MKLRYIFAAIVSSLCLLVSCQEEELTSLNSFQVDKTFVSIPLEGGSVEVNYVARESWGFAKSVLIDSKEKIYAELPTWLTASVLSGEMGAGKIVLTAGAIGYGREQELQINVGNQIQYIMVRQGSMTAQKASCAEVIAGPDGKTYTVTGTCTSIANTDYGNWYLNDGNDEIYIYGTLDKDGATKNFSSLGIEVGDVITVQGPKTTYNGTVELVDVTVLKIVKSLLKVDPAEFKDLSKDGAEFTLKAAFKGKGTFVKECPDWISLSGSEYKAGVPSKTEPNPADTTIMTFRVAPNEGVTPREGIITIASASGKDASEIDVTVTQGANAPDLMTIAEAKQTEYAHIKGTVMAICGRGYVLADETGAILCYYGKNFVADGYKLGDVIEVINATGAYNYGPQLSCDGKEGGFDLEDKKSEGSGKVTWPTPAVLDAAAIDARIAATADKSGTAIADAIPMDYVQVTGTVSVSGNYVNMTVEGTTVQISAYNILSSFNAGELNGKTATMRGYTQSVSTSKGIKYLNVVVTELIEGEAEVPTIQYTDLSTINALADNAEFTLTCVTVASGKNGIVVSDGTTGFYVYKPATTPAIGDIVTVTGTKTTYYNLIESKQGATVTVVESGATIPELTATDVTATFDAYPDGVHGAEFISFSGKYQTSGSNVNVTVEGATKRTGSLQGSVLDPKYDGKNVKVSGYYIGTSGSGGIYFVLIATKIEEL
jgi:hypothetical protein